MNNMKGFTLIESLLVIFICTMFLLLPTLAVNKWRQVLEVNQFLSSFEKQLLYTQQMAVIHSIDTQILFLEERQELNFFTTEETSLKVPQDLQATGPSKIVFKSSSGNNGKLSKYSFSWTEKKQIIEFQFQLGSGRYVKQIRAL